MKYMKCTDTEPGAWVGVVRKANTDTALKQGVTQGDKTHITRHNTKSDSNKKVKE